MEIKAESFKINALLATIAWELETSEQFLAKFAEEVKADPTHALEWSDSAFQKAARRKAYQHLEKALHNHGNVTQREALELYVKRMEDDVLRAASHSISNSSSPTSNLMLQATLREEAQLLVYLKKVIA